MLIMILWTRPLNALGAVLLPSRSASLPPSLFMSLTPDHPSEGAEGEKGLAGGGEDNKGVFKASELPTAKPLSRQTDEPGGRYQAKRSSHISHDRRLAEQSS